MPCYVPSFPPSADTDHRFEAAWEGDIEKIKALTIVHWGPDGKMKPLQVSNRDERGFTPFAIALVSSLPIYSTPGKPDIRDLVLHTRRAPGHNAVLYLVPKHLNCEHADSDSTDGILTPQG